jgi:hypothetical protein
MGAERMNLKGGGGREKRRKERLFDSLGIELWSYKHFQNQITRRDKLFPMIERKGCI